MPADQALGDETFEERPHAVDEDPVGRHAGGGLGPCAGDEALVRDDIGMQEEQVEPRQPQALQARLDGLPQQGLDALGRRIAQVAFAGDPDAGRQSPAEGLADDQLGLAVAVARREVEQRYARRHRRMDGRDAFLDRRLAPQHAEAAAAQRERRDRREWTEGVLLHVAPHPSGRRRPTASHG